MPSSPVPPRRRHRSLLLLGLLTIAFPLAAPAQLVISEIMASNSKTLLDEDQEPSDWIEIANPTDTAVSLLGWSLTDFKALPAKWVFPDVTVPPHGFLVVFASDKNRTASTPLHTNFRLSSEGEFLGLFPPAATQPAFALDPAFPALEADQSYGLPLVSSSEDLLARHAVSVLVPDTASDLAADWTQPAFVPAATWKSFPGLGLGFDSIPAPSNASSNLALRGTATQSTTGFGADAAFAIDGNPDTFTHTATEDVASVWQLDLGADVEVARLILRNRANCCQSRLRDITVSLLAADGRVLWTSPLLNSENALNSPAALELDLLDLNDGPLTARTVRVARTPDPDLSGSGGVGNDDEDNVLSLGEVEVYGIDAISYAPWIRGDLTASMLGRQTSAFARVPFVLDPSQNLTQLTLELRYDDGLAVHLNGTPIAQFNAPSAATWNAAATTERAKSNAVQTVALDLLAHRNLWLQGTNVLAFHLLNASANDPDLLLDARLLATVEGRTFTAFLDAPTPGAANTTGWNLGRVADTRFSVKRGFFQEPFDLEITTDTPGAEIRYTLDGSTPSASRGTNYTGPLRITTTTVVRAAAFKRDFRPTNVDTHTFLFPAQVVQQPARPAGFPATWSSVSADYAMDPRITTAAAFAPQFPATLRALPTLALALPQEDFFGPTRGIYANPERNGADWERATSLEWIDPDGSTRFQVDAGLRIQGGYFRARDVTQKHSLRLLFKEDYGPGKLRADLFEDFGAAREFDTLVLRAGANDGYAWDAARDTEQFTRDEFGRRLFLAMGQPSPRGRFVHLYLNGLYWGVYNLTERPAEDFSATYLGGAPEDWDAINSGEAKNGDLQAWNALITQTRTATNAAAFLRLQGLSPDGTRDPNTPALLEAANYIDYMLLNIWGGNWDWPNKNFWFGRDRTGRAGGFRFYLWDFENTMGNNRDRSPLQMVSPRADIAASWVGEPHDRLKRNPEYRLAFADRVRRHFFHDGVLAPSALVARYQRLAAEFEPAIAAETARWGDDHFSPPQDPTDWARERDWLLNTYLPQRTGVVLAQFRASGLYPGTDAPEFTPHGGPVPPASTVTLSTTAAELLYTTDGSDPRLPGGELNPRAVRVPFQSGVPEVPTTLVTSGHSWRFLDANQVAPAAWTQPGFEDAAWKSGPSPLGYGDGDEATVVAFADADPATPGVQRNATTYFRTTFQVDDPAAYASLRLVLTYDDAGAVFLNGQEVLRTDNLPANAGATTYATGSSSDNALAARENLPASALRRGLNTLAVEIHQSDPTSSDISFDLELTGAVSGSGTVNTAPPLTLLTDTVLKARSRNGTTWSALTEARFAVGAVPAATTNLAITELCIRPPEPTIERPLSTARSDFEFIEFTNLGAEPIDLSGLRLLGAVQFTFPTGTTLGAHTAAVLVSRLDTFQLRYGTQVQVLGTYQDHLGEPGEEIHLTRPDGSTLIRFTYGTTSPWPQPDPSLVLIRPHQRPDPARPESWRSSRFVLGSPGGTDTLEFT
ncbi:MAG: CotH kinase family protein, partial [Verrucomicrobiales bacterium]|nr:CotH kinase family protein [Verrucomicrobiales bacterium]